MLSIQMSSAFSVGAQIKHAELNAEYVEGDGEITRVAGRVYVYRVQVDKIYHDHVSSKD